MVAGLTEAPKSWKYLVEKLFDHAAKHNEHRMDRELGGMRDGGGAGGTPWTANSLFNTKLYR